MKYNLFLGILLLNFHLNRGLKIEEFNNSFVNDCDYEFDEIEESSEHLSKGKSKRIRNIEEPIFDLIELMKEEPLPDVEEENETNESEYPENNSKCPSCECGTKTKPRIVGGKLTAKHEFPFQVALTYKKRFYCGATLINDNYVLTAAHCTYGFQKKHMRCRFLVRNLRNSPKSFNREVIKVWRPKGFNIKTFRHDLSILKLNSKVPITSTSILKPICFTTSRSNFGGKTGTIIGWGRTNEHKPKSKILKKARVPIFTQKICKTLLSDHSGNIIKPDEICAGIGGRNVCYGDSGGPLLIYYNKRFVEIGIVSHGYGCHLPNTPAVFTKVANFLPYILKIVSKGACFCSG